MKWKLVPVEPSQEMLDAAEDEAKGQAHDIFDLDVLAVLREAIKAAPAAPSVPGQIPPLPEPGWVYIDAARDNAKVDCYSKSQMRDYGLKCRRATLAEVAATPPIHGEL